MRTKDFDYDLPKELIAQHPLPERDASRMMVVFRREKKIIHSQFSQFPLHINPNDLLVLNRTRVIPARTWGRKEGKEFEFLFIREVKEGIWEVLCRPAKKLKPGDRIEFEAGFSGRVEGAVDDRKFIRFISGNVREHLRQGGFAPLPPYIKRRKKDPIDKKEDLERYQTVFAAEEGAIAAPTAGLHFTPSMLEDIRNRGAHLSFIILHVGLATFQPVRTEKVEDHLMPEETFFIGRDEAGAVNRTKSEGKKVMAVGTTVVRALEGACRNGQVRAGQGETRLFIYPGFRFRVIDCLLTNFHLPKSTLLMLVSAFAGQSLIREAYTEAVKEKYRFFSYGDCMLIV